jgi:Leucine-rich repeat (LRR) protein
MLYKVVPAVFVLAVVLTICGCKGSTSPSEDVGPTGPSITELEDESKLLDELIATDACVFAFSGTFLEVWMEFEVKEGDSKESKIFSSRHVALTRHMSDQANGTTPVPEGKVIAWGAFSGGLRSDAKMRLRMRVKEASGIRSSGVFSPISMLPLPKELGEGWRGSGGGTHSREFEWKCPAQLPGDGQVFTIASFHRSRGKTLSKPEFKYEVIRSTTFRLKGRCLPLVAPSPAPNEQAAVVALRKKRAWVKLEGFKGEYYEGASQGSAKEVTFPDQGEIEKSQRVADADLIWLMGLSKLQGLDLSTTQITDEGLVHLKGLTELQTLELANTQVTDAGLVHLKGLTNLQRLNLSYTGITDEGLVHLKGLQVTYLTIPDDARTDLGLKHYLAALETKNALYLQRWKITDAGLVHLKGLTGLQKLSLPEQITDAGIAALQKALPDCKIDK